MSKMLHALRQIQDDSKAERPASNAKSKASKTAPPADQGATETTAQADKQEATAPPVSPPEGDPTKTMVLTEETKSDRPVVPVKKPAAAPESSSEQGITERINAYLAAEAMTRPAAPAPSQAETPTTSSEPPQKKQQLLTVPALKPQQKTKTRPSDKASAEKPETRATKPTETRSTRPTEKAATTKPTTSRASQPATEPKSTSSAQPSQLESSVMHYLQNDQLRDQVLKLAQAIERDAAGEPAALSFHACGSDTNALLFVTQLATTLTARCGRQVLMIDADTQAQALTRGFEVSGEAGLIEVFNGVNGWRQVVRELQLPGVAILPAGRGALAEDQPGIKRFCNVLDQIQAELPFVLVYGGRNADQFMRYEPRDFLSSYLVVQLGQSTQLESQDAIDKLQSRNFQITGCVVTGKS